MKPIIKFIPICLCIVVITNCTVLAPTKNTEVQNYLIAQVTANQKCTTYGVKSIYIREVTSSQPYNTNNMLYSYSPYSIQKYTSSQWAALPDTSITQGIATQLQNDCVFNVYKSDIYTHTDYMLTTKIITLQQTIDNNNDTKNILTLDVSLINTTTYKIQNKQFTKISYTEAGPQNLAIGTSQNLKDLTKEISEWVKAAK